MNALTDAWANLRQQGKLLDAKRLDQLPAPTPAGARLVERVRAALLGDDVGQTLDVMLEEAAGLNAGWLKGSALGASYTQKMLDGKDLKPRRVWVGSGSDYVPVFVEGKDLGRLGIGKAKRAAAHVVEYLRKSRQPLGILTNNREWRLVYATEDQLAWVEWDLDRLVDGDRPSDALELWRRLIAPKTLLRPSAKPDDPSPLSQAVRDTRRGESQLTKELGERVRRAVEKLLIARKGAITWDTTDKVAARALYDAACRFVMRLVVLMFAEARGLLPIENRVYHSAYGLRSLIAQLHALPKERRASRQSAWPRLLALFRLLHGGSGHEALQVPIYGGELMQAGDPSGDAVLAALAQLEGSDAEPGEAPNDLQMLEILDLLSRTNERGIPTPVDFTELTSEYIGILYEGLLDYELKRVDDDPMVFLRLGDEPALPLTTLENLSDKQLKDLVEKANVKGKAATDGDGEAGDDEESDGESVDDGEAEATSDADGAGAADGPDEEGDESERELSDDETRIAFEKRAEDWAARAVRVGGLVTKPKGKKGDTDPVYLAKLESAKKNLIVAVKFPGELYLVRWGGTRKGAGTFYTRPQLTLPTVRRTLGPLLYEGWSDRADNDQRVPRTPEAILALNICDPAMGSGSFLVAALRVTVQALVTSLHVHERITPAGSQLRVACEAIPAEDRVVADDARLEAVLRRVVVEHCLYGVDIDPLAVELARAALWIETLDDKLPFTFLDHKLRPGNALIGAWLDRFRDYPLAAWLRESPDRKWKGVNYETDRWHDDLKAKRDGVVESQAKLLSGDQKMPALAISEDELKDAVARVRRLYRELSQIPVEYPDKRAAKWKDGIARDPSMLRLRAAFDTWCALWFWPLDRLEDAPGPDALANPSEASLAVVRALTASRPLYRFFHWELEFPDVFTTPGSGFDAVVGNPPWEIQKPSSKEFFSNEDPLYRTYGKQDALRKQRELFGADPALEGRWLEYVGSFKDRGNFVRHAADPFDVSFGKAARNATLHDAWKKLRARRSGFADPAHPYQHQGSADLNTYKLFFEMAHALLRPGGQVGMVVPSGLYTDKGTSALRSLLLEQCDWRWLYSFENRRQIFDIHRSFKFALVLAEKGPRPAVVRTSIEALGGEPRAIAAAFMRHDLEDWADGKGVLDYPVAQVKTFSPKSQSILEIRDPRDLAVLTKIYANSVLLGDDGPDGWGIKYSTEFHMTNDSKLFVPRDKAEALGYRADVYGRWVGPEGDVLLPLYEGRMVGAFDFSEKGWVSGKGRTAVWRDIPWEDKAIEPQFLMDQNVFRTAVPSPVPLRVGFMDVTSATNKRTMIAALLPPFPCGNKVPLLTPRANPGALAAVLNSFVFDWQLRQRLGGITLNYFIVEDAALPKLDAVAALLEQLAIRLSCVSPVFARTLSKPVADGDLPRGGPLSTWLALTRFDRLRLRCMTDAIVAALLGLSAEDLAWILRDCDWPSEQLAQLSLDPKGFHRVDKEDVPELRQTVLTQVAFRDLSQMIELWGLSSAITDFCMQRSGDGWMPPDELSLADYGLGKDARALEPQPVASCLQPKKFAFQTARDESTAFAAIHDLDTGNAVLPDPVSKGSTAVAKGQTKLDLGTSERGQLGLGFDTQTARAEQRIDIGMAVETNTASPIVPHQENPMHLTQIRIANFKSWGGGEELNHIPLKRITMVLGMNSAGKSSVLLPLRMLKQTVEATDPKIQLQLQAQNPDQVDLGQFVDIVHGHDTKRAVAIGLSLGVREPKVDMSFTLDPSEVPTIQSLVWDTPRGKLDVTRVQKDRYTMSSPAFRLPTWEGDNDVHLARDAIYSPGRAFELPDKALSDLGPTLGGAVRAGTLTYKDMLENLHYLGPQREPAPRHIAWNQQDPSRLGARGQMAYQVLIGSQSKKETKSLLEDVSAWLRRLGIADAIELVRVGSSLLYQLLVVRGSEKSNLVDVGFGVSQVLPVIVLMHFVPEGSTVLIEDPEVHLHPLAQAALADLFVEVSKKRNLQVLLETHSEHIFRRLQLLVAERTIGPSECALYYVQRDIPSAHLESLDINTFGQIKNWPSEFFGDAMGLIEGQVDKMLERMANGETASEPSKTAK